MSIIGVERKKEKPQVSVPRPSNQGIIPIF